MTNTSRAKATQSDLSPTRAIPATREDVVDAIERCSADYDAVDLIAAYVAFDKYTHSPDAMDMLPLLLALTGRDGPTIPTSDHARATVDEWVAKVPDDRPAGRYIGWDTNLTPAADVHARFAACERVLWVRFILGWELVGFAEADDEEAAVTLTVDPPDHVEAELRLRRAQADVEAARSGG